MSVDTLNPVTVEHAIRNTSDRIKKGVKVCNDRYEVFLKASRDFDVAVATAYVNHDGPAHSAKYAAVLATQKEREAKDIADAAYKYAVRQADALCDELRSWQSVGKSVRQMYGAAGVGER